MTKVIGLTGGIATGKTTVSNFFRQAGTPVIDADQVARKVQGPASQGLKQIVKTFGEQVLLPNGKLNRPALGEIVFSQPAARRKLDDLLQPLIREEIYSQLALLKEQKIPLIVLDIPLLFEQHYDKDCDLVVVVYTDAQTQLQRLMDRDNSSVASARARINAQMPLADKVALADIVINNDGDHLALQKQVGQLIKELKAGQNVIK